MCVCECVNVNVWVCDYICRERRVYGFMSRHTHTSQHNHTDGVLRTRHGEYFSPSLRRTIAPPSTNTPTQQPPQQDPAAQPITAQTSTAQPTAAQPANPQSILRQQQEHVRGLFNQARPYIAARMIRYLPKQNPADPSGDTTTPRRTPGALSTAHGTYFDAKRRRQLLLQREAAAREQQRLAAEAERAAAAAAVAAERVAVEQRITAARQGEGVVVEDDDDFEEEGGVVLEDEEGAVVAQAVVAGEQAEEEESPLPRTADDARERLRLKLLQQEQSKSRWGLW